MPIAFLRASTPFDVMVDSSEKSLQKLRYEYVRNGNEKLAEFEITNPAYFRVTVEPNKLPRVRSPILLPGIESPKGTTVDIRLGLDSDDDPSFAMQLAIRFVQTLIETLPAKPWLGLGRLESGREQKRWIELLPDSQIWL